MSEEAMCQKRVGLIKSSHDYRQKGSCMGRQLGLQAVLVVPLTENSSGDYSTEIGQ